MFLFCISNSFTYFFSLIINYLLKGEILRTYDSFLTSQKYLYIVHFKERITLKNFNFCIKIDNEQHQNINEYIKFNVIMFSIILPFK